MASILTRPTPSPSETATRPGRLVGLAVIFLRLGVTSFGGPAAHIALMRDEFVRRRGWLDDDAFVDLIGAANLVPGPTSTELAMHIGHRRAGGLGLVVAGLAFLLPAVAIVATLAWLYVEEGQRPEVAALLLGIAPVVVAVVAHAGWSIARSVVRTVFAAALMAATIVAAVAGLPEILTLLAAGVVGTAAYRGTSGSGDGTTSAGGAASAALVIGGGSGSFQSAWPGALAASTAIVVLPIALFATFLKIGAVLFGSGYLLVALLRAELVEGLGWLTETQLLDAVAIGQATPGPLFSTATFIGYVVGGPVGAVTATVGIFLPAFIAVALSIPLLERLRRSMTARAFLDGVNIAAVGLIGIVAAELAVGALFDPLAIGTTLVAFGLLVRGVGVGRLITLGAVIGLGRLVLATG